MPITNIFRFQLLKEKHIFIYILDLKCVRDQWLESVVMPEYNQTTIVNFQ
jgi:hypothetical protein